MFQPLDMIEWTNQAMLYELMTEPSFGRVTPSTTGAHHDMDHFTFIDSISVINRYMLKIAECCFNENDLMEDYSRMIEIGKACEGAMFQKTRGVNTHKGTIFVLGTLVACTTKVIVQGGRFEDIFHLVKRLGVEKWKEFEGIREPKTNGERLYMEQGFGGVRAEARMGFPLIQKVMGVIDLKDPRTLTRSLMVLMSSCEDTTILHRHGEAVLREVQRTMRRLLKEDASRKEIEALSCSFIERGISPGGSADLLCGAIFMKLIKDNYFIN